MQKVFFFDIDDCLIETSRLGKAELTALENSLNFLHIPKSSQIAAEFASLFHRLYNQHQGKILSKKDFKKLNQYMDRLKLLQTNIVQEFGQVKKWSREAFLYLAAEKFAVKLTAHQIN